MSKSYKINFGLEMQKVVVDGHDLFMLKDDPNGITANKITIEEYDELNKKWKSVDNKISFEDILKILGEK